MKISFIWPFDKAEMILPNWRDGHRKVIEELSKVYEVTRYIGNDVEVPDDSEFILIWTDATDPIIQKYAMHPARKAIMLTSDNGINTQNDNLRFYDVIYCESDVVKDQVRRMGLRAIKAMGTDTDFYSPVNRDKDIEYFYPATFSPWKRQSKIAYLGKKLLCVGTIQPDGQFEHDTCVQNKVQVKVGYFPPEEIRDYYNRAKNVIIPAIHGSERTVLESMAMNIQPYITNENNKRALSYVLEYLASGEKTPREFVLKNYSHKQYLEALLRGIEG